LLDRRRAGHFERWSLKEHVDLQNRTVRDICSEDESPKVGDRRIGGEF